MYICTQSSVHWQKNKRFNQKLFFKEALFVTDPYGINKDQKHTNYQPEIKNRNRSRSILQKIGLLLDIYIHYAVQT